MRESPRCDEVRDVIPELAMGVASGEVRARALAHITGCIDCRRELDEAAAIVDELLLLAPEHEPPRGFDTRVLAAIEDRRPRRALRSVLAAAAAVVLVAGLTGWAVWDRSADDRTLAESYRETLAVANGRYLTAADLKSASGEAGHVFAYAGDQSWLFVSVEGAESGTYQVRLVTTDGQVVDVGSCRVPDGRGSWGTTIDVRVNTIDRVELTRDGEVDLTAQFG